MASYKFKLILFCIKIMNFYISRSGQATSQFIKSDAKFVTFSNIKTIHMYRAMVLPMPTATAECLCKDQGSPSQFSKLMIIEGPSHAKS